ncbi:unnamed protein product [Ambrosiozyma monospora]|uniref:Unnamed protein product n=1 Tax=Ambrosiozyma monospora TaxID=43982 RepID=A0ACB5TM58_AMBMO|nr:unnamed protein product [Ambrosiozyma monospora]
MKVLSVFDNLVGVENTIDDSSYFASVGARGESKNGQAKQQRQSVLSNYEIDKYDLRMDASQYNRMISKAMKSIDPNACSESSLVELSKFIVRNKPAKSNIAWKLNKRLFLKVVNSRIGGQIDSDKGLLRSLLNGMFYSLLHVSHEHSQLPEPQLSIQQSPLTTSKINNILETLALFKQNSIRPDLSTWAFILYIFGGGSGNSSKLQKRLIEMMVSKRLNILVVKDIALAVL